MEHFILMIRIEQNSGKHIYGNYEENACHQIVIADIV